MIICFDLHSLVPQSFLPVIEIYFLFCECSTAYVACCVCVCVIFCRLNGFFFFFFLVLPYFGRKLDRHSKKMHACLSFSFSCFSYLWGLVIRA